MKKSLGVVLMLAALFTGLTLSAANAEGPCSTCKTCHCGTCTCPR